MSTATTRRDRRRERSRNELVSAARAVIAEKGVGDLRVSDVTERCDVALGSFYRHFETKDEIIEAVVSEAVTELADAIGDVADHLDDPAEAVSVGARRLVGICETDPELARLLVRLEDAEPRYERMIWPRGEPIMRRGVESGRFRVVDSTLALRIAIAAVLATIRAVVDEGVDGDPAVNCSAAVLRSFGVARREADAIARRPLPALAGD